jgi:hypothetical protein
MKKCQRDAGAWVQEVESRHPQNENSEVFISCDRTVTTVTFRIHSLYTSIPAFLLLPSSPVAALSRCQEHGGWFRQYNARISFRRYFRSRVFVEVYFNNAIQFNFITKCPIAVNRGINSPSFHSQPSECK